MLHIASVTDVIAKREFMPIWERRIEPWCMIVESSAVQS